MDPTSKDSPESPTTSEGEAQERDHREQQESAFRFNLETFGGRAARLSALFRRGRISADGCFLALTQLWVQLARSHRVLDDRSGGESEQEDERA